MPLPKQHAYTSEDYWNLPDGQRAELIDGQLYNMAPPTHHRLPPRIRRCTDHLRFQPTSFCRYFPGS